MDGKINLSHQRTARFGRAEATVSDSDEESENSVTRFFLDIAVVEEPLGRFVMAMPSKPDISFPQRRANLLKLTAQSRRSIDPSTHYTGCTWTYGSLSFWADTLQYRWAHTLSGRGRNAVGRSIELIAEDMTAKQAHTHRIFGGTYYGLNYEELMDSILPTYYADVLQNELKEVVLTTPLLTVPTIGPGRRSTQFNLVRVAESPLEWRDHL